MEDIKIFPFLHRQAKNINDYTQILTIKLDYQIVLFIIIDVTIHTNSNNNNNKKNHNKNISFQLFMMENDFVGDCPVTSSLPTSHKIPSNQKVKRISQSSTEVIC